MNHEGFYESLSYCILERKDTLSVHKKLIANGEEKEFAYHEKISHALNDVPFYFPKPHQL